MATRPNDVPRWASDSGRVEPPEGKKDIGWEDGEKPPAGFFNWLGGLVGDWLAWLKAVTVHRGDNLLGVHGLRAGSDGVESAGPVLSADYVGAPHVEAFRASNSPAVRGLNQSNGTGVHGYSKEGFGVRGIGAVAGVSGEGVDSAPGVEGRGDSEGPGVRGVGGDTAGAVGVEGVGGSGGGPGVMGTGGGGDGIGVLGTGAGDNPGVYGLGAKGVYGEGIEGPGVYGEGIQSNSAGVEGKGHLAGPGVKGTSDAGPGVVGEASTGGPGVLAVPRAGGGAPLRIQSGPTGGLPADPKLGDFYVMHDINEEEAVLYFYSGTGPLGGWTTLT